MQIARKESEMVRNNVRACFSLLNRNTHAGLGINLNEKALSLGENPKILDTPIGFDGSVQDR